MRRAVASPPQTIRVLSLSPRAQRGRLTLGVLTFPCALGRAGGRHLKREGDGASPRGTWTIESVVYRADRIGRPRTGLAVRAMRPEDGWCDAPCDRNYNRAVRHPYPASAERLWRDDCLYDAVAVLSHNRLPRVRGLGSAIFMHVARPGYEPTAGCIALPTAPLMRLLAHLRRGARIRIL